MICTNIEQSRKLVEIGVSQNTADMWYGIVYEKIGREDDDFDESSEIKNYTKYPSVKESAYTKEGIPAWSLSALLELMPHCIIGWDGLEYTRITKGNVLEYSNQESGYKKSLISIPSNNLLSPAYNMIIWLKENKYI